MAAESMLQKQILQSLRRPPVTVYVDSFPVPCCKATRIDRRKFLLGKEYIGYLPSERRYFCGVKVHMVVTIEGKPVELALQPASYNDLSVLWDLELDLPENSRLYADGAYMSFDLEDLLAQDSKIQLLAKYKQSNTKRVRSLQSERRISSKRQIVETAFSWITNLFPRSIRASTRRGFLLRIVSAVLAYGIHCLSA